MKIAKTDVVTGGKCRVPTDRYRVRICGTEYGKSQSGNAMTTLTLEVIEPEKIPNPDNPNESLNIAGKQFKIYLVHNPNLVGKQTQSSQASVFEFMDRLGIEIEKDENGSPVYDTDLHKEYFLGMEFDMVLSSEEDIKRYPPKPGQRLGEPIKDGDGKDITNGWRIVAQTSDVCPNCRPTRTEMEF